MSTYTKLHNRIRENLTVLRQPGNELDGITQQRVIFENPENIYEGTFKGKIDATDVSLSSVSLTDVTINGGKILDAEIWSGGESIQLTTLTSDLAEISGLIDDALSAVTSAMNQVSAVSSQFENFDSRLTTLSTSISDIVGEIVSPALSSISSAILSDLTSISTDVSYLSINVLTLSSNDKFLSNAIDDVTLSVKEAIPSSMHYFGTLLSGYDENKLIWFLHSNFGSGSDSHIFKNGDQFRISTDISLSDSTEAIVKFHKNDYLVFNKDVVLTDVTINDIDVIQSPSSDDDMSFIEQLSTDLYNVVSIDLSNTMLSVEEAFDLVHSTCLVSNDVKLDYHNKTLWLSSKSYVTSVDCADFIKDGMLSTAELCGTTLVLTFNTDAKSDPISVELSNFIDNYDDRINVLSNSIDKKIFISNSISGISGYSDLSIIKLNASEYANLLTSDQLLSNAFYVIEDDYKNAYGQQIKNVALPNDLSDAATKGYVDDAIISVQGWVEDKGYAISSDLSDVATTEYVDNAVSSKTDRSEVTDMLDNRLAGYVQRSEFNDFIVEVDGDFTDVNNKLTTINSLIPNQATSQNQLVDKAFVNSSVQTATANFRGNWATWAAVPSTANVYPPDYMGSRTPTVNDYMVVQDASGFGGPETPGTWRFKYSGVWATNGKDGWLAEYQVNETPMTAAQLAALNSGITSQLVSEFSAKQDALSVSQIAAIDQKLYEMQTHIVFSDNTRKDTLIVGIFSSKDLDGKQPISVRFGNVITSIGDNALQDCQQLTNVVIPDSVTSIGYSAFYQCYGLTNIVIPDSVTSISGSAFSGCTGLTSVTIPNSITSIEGAAFYNCRGLMSIMIPNSVTSIMEDAFARCGGLTSMTIPDSVTTIKNYAFSESRSLSEVTIPNSVTNIGYGSFNGCTGLTSVVFIGKTLVQVQAMARFPWGINPSSIITTWNDASQEWVKEQGYAISSDLSNDFQTKGNYLSSNALNDYKTYNSTVSSLSNDGYILSSQISAKIDEIDTQISDLSDSVHSINETLSSLAEDAVISSFYQIATNNFNSVVLSSAISALCKLIERLTFIKMLS